MAKRAGRGFAVTRTGQIAPVKKSAKQRHSSDGRLKLKTAVTQSFDSWQESYTSNHAAQRSAHRLYSSCIRSWKDSTLSTSCDADGPMPIPCYHNLNFSRRVLIFNQVVGYNGHDQLGNALKGARIVIIPAGVPRKPGKT